MAKKVEVVTTTELSDEEKAVIARSPFFNKILLCALVIRNEEVAVDLFEYVRHYPDLKAQLEQYITSVYKDGRVQLPRNKKSKAKRRLAVAEEQPNRHKNTNKM